MKQDIHFKIHTRPYTSDLSIQFETSKQPIKDTQTIKEPIKDDTHIVK